MSADDAEKSLLSIGTVAKSYGVSENRIRRMESAGLLEPAYTSESSGYRYYDSADIAQISTVLALKSFGFANADIKTFVNHPDDLSTLYQKLQDMQQTIIDLMQQLAWRMKAPEAFQCELADFDGAVCYTKAIKLTPQLSTLSDIAREVLFEAVKKVLPIDCTRPLLIETQYTHYKAFDPAVEQDAVFYVPLREVIQGPDISILPPVRAVSLKWSYPGMDYFEIVPIIDRFFERCGIRQSGTLRATFDMGDYSVKHADVSHTVIHFLIPIEPTDGKEPGTPAHILE